MTAQEIKQAINDHLAKSNKQYYSDFYIGITNDIERRLFGEHNVSRKEHWWIHRTANSETHARAVEKHFLSDGMKGGPVVEIPIVYMYIVMKYPTKQ
jgi:hypothetical protein